MTFANHLLHDVIDLLSYAVIQAAGWKRMLFQSNIFSCIYIFSFPGPGLPGWASYAPQSTRLADAIDKPIT
jgi:hypothetical protein